MIPFLNRFRYKKLPSIGLPPGTLVFTGEKKVEKIHITIIAYDKDNYVEKEIDNIDDFISMKKLPGVVWLNIDGLHNLDLIEKIGRHYNIHPLTLEDILNVDQRPKMEEFENYIFYVVKMLTFDQNTKEIISEQVSFILMDNCLISFQEREGDVFQNVRGRLKNDKGRVRKMGADYLTYSLIDAIVDNYFVVVENIAEIIEYLEEEIISNPSQKTSASLHKIKRELIFLRKSLWPLRELINSSQRNESKLISSVTLLYFRDLYDNIVQLIDMLESYRDIITGMIDIYLSSLSNRMNEIMKVLTVIGTIFIPLTFLVGVYGMNFRYMPELKWRWSYPIVWGVMIFVGIFLFALFKRKKWI